MSREGRGSNRPSPEKSSSHPEDGAATRPAGLDGPAAPEDDAVLVAKFLQGEAPAFDRLVSKHYQKVFHLVWGIVGDWHLSEDVCQEVFTAVYRKVSAFRAQARFSTWLHRIAVNAALKARGRRKRTAEEPLSGLQEPEAARAVEERAAFESDEVVLKLLKPLPDKLRAAVILREVGGWSYEEIARILKCTRGTVEQRLHRGMNLLREIWQGRSMNP